VDSIAIGKQSLVPRDVLLPFLNSVAEFMDRETEEIDGKPLLDTILKVQENAGMAKKGTVRARAAAATANLTLPPSMQMPTSMQQAILPSSMQHDDTNQWYDYT